MENNIEPTLKFYADVLGEKEAIGAPARDPRLILYSLERRLKPRLEEATEWGINMDLTMLNYLAKLTNKKWAKKIENYKLKQLKDRKW